MIVAGQAPDRSPASLEEIHSSVPIPGVWWRRILAFSGPAFLISVGYMDPGNWGTDIEGGSKYGYRLMWVLLMSNAMAVLLQTLASRLGIVTGRDLAQACRESYPRAAAFALWILCEIAVAACDLAEVIGTVIALKLLFQLPYVWGVIIAAADTFLLLALQRRGVRLLELITLALVAIIAGSFFIEIILARPDWAGVVRGLLPGLDTTDPEHFKESLYLAIGIVGATVMPHNLYLHSALVQTRAFPHSVGGKSLACRYNLLDSIVALNGAFFVNAAILILSVSTFHAQRREVETLQDAQHLLGLVWGPLAGLLFAVALLASGQSSTLTGTLAGQVIMEGFVHLRIRPWARRLLTRSLAILPALLAIVLSGNGTAWGSESVDQRLLGLLVLSQVILCFQLPFAVIPLVQFTSDRRRMGEFANRGWVKSLAWICALTVVVLNAILIVLQLLKWGDAIAKQGGNPMWIDATVGSTAALLAGFLGWLTLYPVWARREEAAPLPAAPELPGVRYHRIGVAVEFAGGDDAVLVQAAALARSHAADMVVVHVVEGLGAAYYGASSDDHESRADRKRMEQLVEHLKSEGLTAEGVLGYGHPAEELVRIAQEEQVDLLVLGTHGHRFLADLALGQTVSPVLHRLSIPVLVVPTKSGVGIAATEAADNKGN
ncbi:MAG TPA: Nramp family divalent metal transporter [Gemmataceae bacterium]|nr:Nramp family divalent metal transporter [Gemmataceae bacterium]